MFCLLLIGLEEVHALVGNSLSLSGSEGFLRTEGVQIVDGNGQVVLLRGVNYEGYYWKNPFLHTEADYRYLAKIGFNVVRLPISWAHLEPSPGRFERVYLTNYVDQDIGWAKKYGIRIVLDMHQDNWARRFPKGGGAPDWTVQQYPQTEAGMRQAVSNFWINDTLQDHFIGIWINIASRYANETVIAGYDILNEPWVYTSYISDLSATNVINFYEKAISAIRKVDTYHLIFLEPPFGAPLNNVNLPIRANIVWSPHFYPLSFSAKYFHENATTLTADFAAKYKKFVLESESPVWIGEFGAFMKDEKSVSYWLQDATGIFQEHQVGWAWWSYSEGQLIPSSLSPSS